MTDGREEPNHWEETKINIKDFTKKHCEAERCQMAGLQGLYLRDCVHSRPLIKSLLYIALLEQDHIHLGLYTSSWDVKQYGSLWTHRFASSLTLGEASITLYPGSRTSQCVFVFKTKCTRALTFKWVGGNLYVILVNNTQGKSLYGPLNCQKLGKMKWTK